MIDGELTIALLRAVSAHPGLTFAGLLDAVRAAGLDVGATEIDAAARALWLEHGEPGAYRYWLPGSVAVGGDVRQDEGEHGLAPPGLRGVAVARHEPLSGLAEVGVERTAVLVTGRADEPPGADGGNLLIERGSADVRGMVSPVVGGVIGHPDTIASSPAQSTLPGMWR